MTTGVKPVESVQAIPQGEMDALLLGRIKVWIEFQIEKFDNSNLFLIQNYLFFHIYIFFIMILIIPRITYQNTTNIKLCLNTMSLSNESKI
jgi:hypothetical protein